MTSQLVVGGIIVDFLAHPTRVAAARRSTPAHLAGRWEFPGGKVEPGETAQAALIRELAEELGVAVEVGDELPHPDGSWPIDETHHLRLFFVRVTAGELIADDSHDRVQWLTLDDLAIVDWLPADAAALPALQERLTHP